MTTQDIVNYYANLLIYQYVGQPNAYATIQTVVNPVVMDQLPTSIQNAFNITTAVGAQLDIIGKYIGVTRNGNTLVGPVVLDDADFRTLMMMVIIQNNSGSSLATIQSLLAGNFPGQIFVSDSANMTLDYVLVESLGTSNLLEILISGGYLPAPMGVQISATIVPAHTNSYFGFRTYEAAGVNVSPFNNYANYQKTYPWLSYKGI